MSVTPETLVTDAEVIKILRLDQHNYGEPRAAKDAKVALNALWRKYVDLCHDDQKPKPTRMETGRGRYVYTPETVADWVEALKVT